jgi:PKD repeat protein
MQIFRVLIGTGIFGDGTTSAERYPVHTYKDGGQYIVTLSVEGPAGKSRKAKVWDVTLK